MLIAKMFYYKAPRLQATTHIMGERSSLRIPTGRILWVSSQRLLPQILFRSGRCKKFQQLGTQAFSAILSPLATHMVGLCSSRAKSI